MFWLWLVLILAAVIVPIVLVARLVVLALAAARQAGESVEKLGQIQLPPASPATPLRGPGPANRSADLVAARKARQRVALKRYLARRDRAAAGLRRWAHLGLVNPANARHLARETETTASDRHAGARADG